MWSIFRLFSTEQGYALFQHASGIETALTELKKYSVFSKVTIALSQDIALGLMGEQADSFVDSFAQGEGDVRSCPGGRAVRIEPNRWLLLMNAEQAEALSRDETLALSDESLWDLADIRAGLPRITNKQQNSHIPQALNLQLLDGVSFSKGCYTGQETVARARYRGSNKRAMYLLQSDCVEQPLENGELERALGDNWRSAGELLCHYRFRDGALLGLAVLPNNLEPETAFRLSQQPEARLHFAPMPYAMESE
jgi:folate-binding protein YgfZ